MTEYNFWCSEVSMLNCRSYWELVNKTKEIKHKEDITIIIPIKEQSYLKICHFTLRTAISCDRISQESFPKTKPANQNSC